ncbi:MAG: T9SS type A sorting domain-containing protein [Bacteroidetes bacterium]|nr:T9SS type A sorting domain-containing protein [Bacteroidota bacterium]
MSIFKPELCIQVYGIGEQAVAPYVGFLIPEDWKVKDNFPCSKSFNGISTKIGEITHSGELTFEMQELDPAPNGYKWWVGQGDFLMGKKGVYYAHPQIKTGEKTDKFQLDYMLGDSFNGLNFIRSDKKPITVVNDETPRMLKASANNKHIDLKWKAPANTFTLLGYDVYRNGQKITSHLVTDEFYSDADITNGSYEYQIMPVYIKPHGEKSIPAKICHSLCGPSVMLDGYNDKVLVFDDPSLHLDGHLTLEAWIKQNYADTEKPRIISKGGNGNGFEFFLSNLNGVKSLEFALPVGNLKSKTPIYPGTWYHVAATYDGEFMRIYINGKLDCEKVALGKLVISDDPMLIGRSSLKNRHHFNGNIDEVRIWNVMRTADEIWDKFASKLKGTESGLVGSWSMSEGCEYMSCDLSPEGNDAYLVGGNCWCAIPFPFVEDQNNLTNPGLVIPVMNYIKENPVPQIIELQFKINPKLVQFQGVDASQTQLTQFKLITTYNPNGNIKIIAVNNHHAIMHGNTLIKIDLKALQPNLKTELKFHVFKVDEKPMRTSSGEVVVAAIPGMEKTTGLADQNNSLIRNLYPNPATTTLNVELGELSSDGYLEVLNMTGQVVYSLSMQEGNSNSVYTIDLIGFSKGVYLVKLVNNGTAIVKKFTKN